MATGIRLVELSFYFFPFVAVGWQLGRERTREWFRFAERLRMEHEQDRRID
ncbi:MAG: hypothetical protein U0790_03690 [Isosphaeraceae bacterium]